MKINLFYLGSYSHLIIAHSIILEKKLPLEQVYFVTYRGVKLPPQYKKNLLYDESVIVNRKMYFLRNFIRFYKLFWKRKVCAYFPFQREFPVNKFFSEYVFFEEGISAYDSSMDYKYKKKKYHKLLLIQFALSPFLSKNMRGLLNGKTNGSPFPFQCSLIGLTETSYSNDIIENCHREIIHIANEPLKQSPIKNSVIIVMDSTHAVDRMDSAENYLSIMAKVLKEHDFNSRKVYLKLHPDNFKDQEQSVSLIKKYIGFLDFCVIDESLEDIALSNQNNIFFGNHSTVLFYAPIFGNTNKSVSFARINALHDQTYFNFLRRWGGVEGAISLFSQQINCL